MDEKEKAALTQKIALLSTGGIATIIMGAAVGVVFKMLATRYKISDMSGDKIITPTEASSAASKSELAATGVEGKLAQDKVSASNGELGASNLGAAAQAGDVDAVDSNVTAAATKTGALDVGLESMKVG